MSSSSGNDVDLRGAGREPLRVLNLIDALQPGGAQTIVLVLAKELSARGIHVTVADLSRKRHGVHPWLVERLREVAQVEHVEARGMSDLRAVFALRQLVHKYEIDVIQTHLAMADVLGSVAGRLTGRPVVAMLHSSDGDRTSHPRRRRLTHLFAIRHLATRLIAVSGGVRDAYVDQLGVCPDKIDTIPNVPLAPLLLPEGFDATRKRRELGLGDGPVVCIASRLVPQKDHATLLQALPKVLQRLPSLTLLIAGEGSLRPELERFACELGVSDAVRFLGLRDDVAELIFASDVTCNLTGTAEGMPLVVLDAMGLGRPVIATAVPGVIELIDNGITGILVPPRDPEAVATALLAVLADEEGRVRMGAAAQVVRSERDHRHWIEEIEGVYERVLG